MEWEERGEGEGEGGGEEEEEEEQGVAGEGEEVGMIGSGVVMMTDGMMIQSAVRMMTVAATAGQLEAAAAVEIVKRTVADVEGEVIEEEAIARGTCH